MAKGIYIGVGDTAKKVKKAYVGFGGVPKKVKKAYVGVNEVPKLVYSGGLEKYTGTVPDLSTNRGGAGGASIGDYAIFCGGEIYDENPTYTYDTYNSALVRTNGTIETSPSVLSLRGKTFGDYAVFAGNASYNFYVRTFTFSLVQGIHKVDDGNTNRYTKDYGLAKVGNYLLFGGGSASVSSSTTVISTVYTLNKSLVSGTAPSLSVARSSVGGANNDNYVLFGTGYNGTGGTYQTVDAYNSSLVRTIATSLTAGTYLVHGAKAGDKALFMSGLGSGDRLVSMESFNNSLVKTVSSLPYGFLGGNSVEYDDSCLHCGGTGNLNYPVMTGIVVSPNLTVEVLPPWTTESRYCSMARAGDYYIFPGGVYNLKFFKTASAYVS